MHLPPAVIVHGLPHARAALAPGLPATLLSAPGAALFAGAGWWRALMQEAGNPPNILDCGDAPGRALEALRCRLPILILQAPPAIVADIAERAARQHAILLAAPPPALDLKHHGAHRHLQSWLAQPSACLLPLPPCGTMQPHQPPHVPTRLERMSGTEAHIAALFETTAAAHAAQAALVAAGIPAASILVLDRGNPDTGGHVAHSLWGALKARLLPDHHAHHYAEGVTRGHPLVIVEVDAALHDAAIATLQAQHPLDVGEHAETWRDNGWSGEHPGQEAWAADAVEDEPVAASEGVVGGDLLIGDYGAVGGLLRDARVDTDIRHGTLVRAYRIR